MFCLTRRLIKPQFYTKCRIITQFQSSSTISEDDKTQKDEFKTIYKYPLIRVFAVTNRLKYLQTILTVSVVPTSGVLYGLNICNADIFNSILVAGICGCIALHSIGLLANNFVGFLYINKTEDKLKIAYTDFWGLRRDHIVNINDIIPFSEMPDSITDKLYYKIKLYSTNKCFKMNINRAHILDKAFQKVFPLTR